MEKENMSASLGLTGPFITTTLEKKDLSRFERIYLAIHRGVGAGEDEEGLVLV